MFGCTRGVEAFLKKTAIAYGGDPSKNAKFWWYAIAVFFKNASTPRVLNQRAQCGREQGWIYGCTVLEYQICFFPHYFHFPSPPRS